MSKTATALGIDIGGSGIKGGIVDLETGKLIGERHKILTPSPATPKAVAKTVKEIVDHFQWTGPIGITLPSVIVKGIAKTASNIDKSWIGTDATALFSTSLGNPVTVLNDADAAGIAEYRYGAAKGYTGSIILLTFGTGIGSAFIVDGTLFPNTELGHLLVGDKEAEVRAAASVKEHKNLSYEQWAKQVKEVLKEYERLFWPELFIVGGGISRKSEKWLPLINIDTPIISAKLLNEAGIVGAAYIASQTPTS